MNLVQYLVLGILSAQTVNKKYYLIIIIIFKYYSSKKTRIMGNNHS